MPLLGSIGEEGDDAVDVSKSVQQFAVHVHVGESHGLEQLEILTELTEVMSNKGLGRGGSLGDFSDGRNDGDGGDRSRCGGCDLDSASASMERLGRSNHNRCGSGDGLGGGGGDGGNERCDEIASVMVEASSMAAAHGSLRRGFSGGRRGRSGSRSSSGGGRRGRRGRSGHHVMRGPVTTRVLEFAQFATKAERHGARSSSQDGNGHDADGHEVEGDDQDGQDQEPVQLALERALLAVESRSAHSSEVTLVMSGGRSGRSGTRGVMVRVRMEGRRSGLRSRRGGSESGRDGESGPGMREGHHWHSAGRHHPVGGRHGAEASPRMRVRRMMMERVMREVRTMLVISSTVVVVRVMVVEASKFRAAKVVLGRRSSR